MFIIVTPAILTFKVENMYVKNKEPQHTHTEYTASTVLWTYQWTLCREQKHLNLDVILACVIAKET